MGTVWCLYDPTPSGESFSKAWTCFKDLLHKVPHHGIDLWLKIQIFYDHVSFHLKCEIDHAAGGKLRDKKAKESWEIIENLALYDHEGWNDLRDFAKPVKHTTSRTQEKVLVGEEANNPITRCINSIPFLKIDKDKSIENNDVADKNVIEPSELNEVEPIEEEMEDGTDNESVGGMKEELTRGEMLVEMPRSEPIGYYLKHEINEKLIKGLVDNHKYNDSLLAKRLGKIDYENYNSLPMGPMYNAILKKKLVAIL
ncbi:hypothetical protein Tco_1127452 [Tanacetum coccineum]